MRVLFVISCLFVYVRSTLVDPKGYIAYCPCMGRFGNQADQFLGALAFAKALDRTLILPPWVEYHWPNPKSVQVPFDTYFKISSVAMYHKVMTMELFMREVASYVWPVGERTVFCYSPRAHIVEKQSSNEPSCAAKDGNPFGPFWDTFEIDFDKSEFYGPLHYDSTNPHEIIRWNKKYPADKYPVLAFTGAPGSFPVAEGNVQLQKYVQWSDNINNQVDKFIKDNMVEGPFVTIHLRLGSDFQNACDHLEGSPSMFAAPQCFGYRGEHGKPTKEMCYPSDDVIVKQVKKAVKKVKAKSVFIGTDSRDLIDKMSKAIKGVKFVKSKKDNPHLDLALMARGDIFIGNCFSTFTAFVKRERDVKKLPSEFWAFQQKSIHDEF